MVRNQRDISSGAFTVTNFTEDYAFDANTATLEDTSDVLATLIRDLQSQGIVSGTVAA